jgi:hypothetical protein
MLWVGAFFLLSSVRPRRSSGEPKPRPVTLSLSCLDSEEEEESFGKTDMTSALDFWALNRSASLPDAIVALVLVEYLLVAVLIARL